MENFQTSNNLLHIWSTPAENPVNEVLSNQSHYGLIYELSTDARYDYKALFFMVMGEDDEKGYKPMCFDYVTGSFCWAYPCDDNGNGQFGEVYDKATAMKLISHHVLNSSCAAKLKLFPVHIPFVSAKPDGYQNPYLFDGDSAELVEQRCVEHMENYCYEDEKWYMPSTLGGDLIGFGSLTYEREIEKESKVTPAVPTSLERQRAEFDKALAYLKATPLADKEDAQREEESASTTTAKPLICKVKKNLAFSLPDLPDSLTDRPQPQYYMITGVRKGQEDDLVAGPMTRHTECPLYFADTYGHPDEQLPSPLLFPLDTAKQLIKDQKDWEEKNNVDPDQRFVMFFFPVFPDNGNVQIAPKQSQKLTAIQQ